MQHTPLPWKCSTEKLYRGHHVAGRGPKVFGADNALIAQVYPGKTRDGEANADYIVKAVNNYPAMLKALRELVDFKVRYRPDADTDELLDAISSQFDGLQDKARAVLATIDGNEVAS